MTNESSPPNLSALPVAQVAKLLRHAGSEYVTENSIQADIAAGAPTNSDGTLNLVVYGAWLVRELARRGIAHE